MLTKEDKKFLTESFATKADINSITDDIKLLATKAELVGIKTDIIELKVDSTLLQQAVQRLEQNVARTEGKIDKLITIGDGNAGNIADLKQENNFGAITLHRHDIQIHELATATGTAISE